MVSRRCARTHPQRFVGQQRLPLALAVSSASSMIATLGDTIRGHRLADMWPTVCSAGPSRLPAATITCMPSAASSPCTEWRVPHHRRAPPVTQRPDQSVRAFGPSRPSSLSLPGRTHTHDRARTLARALHWSRRPGTRRSGRFHHLLSAVAQTSSRPSSYSCIDHGSRIAPARTSLRVEGWSGSLPSSSPRVVRPRWPGHLVIRIRCAVPQSLAPAQRMYRCIRSWFGRRTQVTWSIVMLASMTLMHISPKALVALGGTSSAHDRFNEKTWWLHTGCSPNPTTCRMHQVDGPSKQSGCVIVPTG